MVAQRRLRKGALFTPFFFFFSFSRTGTSAMVRVKPSFPQTKHHCWPFLLGLHRERCRYYTTFLLGTVNRFYCIGGRQGILGHIARWEGFPSLQRATAGVLEERERRTACENCGGGPPLAISHSGKKILGVWYCTVEGSGSAVLKHCATAMPIYNCGLR